MNQTDTTHSSHLWHWLVHGTADSKETDHHIYVVHIYTLLAFFCLSVFGALNLVEGNSLVGRLELAGSLALLLNVLGLRQTHNANMARTYLLLTVMVMLFVMVMTGGTQGTGIFWFFAFPVIAFFLGGRKQGLWWMMALYVMMLGILLLVHLSLVHIPYALITIRQLMVCLAVVAIGIYVYQGARETAMSETLTLNRTKTEFITLASHQLRTPISAISWFAEMLLSGDAGKLTKEQRKDIEQIYHSNQRMAALINDMLIVSKLDLGSLPVKPVKSDIAAITRGVLKDMKHGILADRRLTITEAYAKDAPQTAVDPEVMRIILRNLISNAVKYTPDKGKITIRISPTSKTLPHGDKAGLQIDVEDTGYGIPRAVQEKLFTKFFRGQNIREKDTDGTGLGLFIVKNLLDYVGGQLIFTSEENAGSVFTVLLPQSGMLEHEET